MQKKLECQTTAIPVPHARRAPETSSFYEIRSHKLSKLLGNRHRLAGSWHKLSNINGIVTAFSPDRVAHAVEMRRAGSVAARISCIFQGMEVALGRRKSAYFLLLPPQYQLTFVVPGIVLANQCMMWGDYGSTGLN
jgi:hypothetical protein